jgi:hypothetical protein
MLVGAGDDDELNGGPGRDHCAQGLGTGAVIRCE